MTMHYIVSIYTPHTIRKRKKMAGQNTFQIILLSDANMIGEHYTANFLPIKVMGNPCVAKGTL